MKALHLKTRVKVNNLSHNSLLYTFLSSTIKKNQIKKFRNTSISNSVESHQVFLSGSKLLVKVTWADLEGGGGVWTVHFLIF